MTRDEAKEFLITISYKFGNMSIEYLTEKDGEKMREAIKALEQQTCEDAVSREAVLGLFAQNADAVRPYSKTWEEVKALPSVKPQYTEDEIQKMQDLEQAELEKAYELGRTEGQKSEDSVSRQAVEKITWEEPSYTDALNVLTEVREKIRQLPSVNPQPKTGWIPVSERLPEQYKEVIVTDIETTGTYLSRYIGNGHWECDNGLFDNRIIAWMPLPQPYEPQESEE